jgi:DNA replication and repair protein RecF
LLAIKQIQLTQFKNYTAAAFTFDRRVIGICGKNGIGKTNLLDAIYYLCFTRSYFARQDNTHASHGMVGFRLAGSFEREGKLDTVTAVLREQSKKEVTLNEAPYSKMAQHIGYLPCVMVAPDDVEIVNGAAEERRRFLDALLSQISQDYLQRLVQYNRILQQRNSHLKLLSQESRPADELLEVYDEQLVSTGTLISEHRKSFLHAFIPSAEKFYQQISRESYAVGLRYDSTVQNADYLQMLRNNHARDIYLQRTSVGIHRDDITFLLDGRPFKQIASQGQRKSLLFALKLAEYSALRDVKGFAPILLLDDIFEKLDAARMHNLLQWVCQQNDGQVILTDTHCERLENALTALQTDYQLINL